MKKILFSILTVIFICSTVTAGIVEKHGRLAVNGIYMVDKNNDPVVLRGVSYGWHNWWPRFYNAGAVKTLTDDWGCTVVRAAMGVAPQGGYIDKPQWSEDLICKVVDAAIAQDIYVIIDWHSHTIKLDEAVDFFTRMAHKYGNRPNIIYEIFNEPERQSWEEVKSYSEEVIKAIRAVDKDNIILVGCPHWDQDVHIVADDPLKDYRNIMYSLHFYAASHKQFLRERGDYAISKGIPLFVSECASMQSTGNGALDPEEWGRWVQWMENNKISWVVWSVSDKDETCSMLLPGASDSGPWSAEVMKESGVMAREYIRRYNNVNPTNSIRQ